MLTIHKKDGTSQIVKVSPLFYLTEVQGKGNNKRVITYREKSESLAHYLSTSTTGNSNYCGHTLTQGEETLIKVGIIATKPLPPTKDWNRVLVKDAKRQYKKFIEETYSFERKHGYSLNEIWKQNAQKSILASSTTQMI